MPVKTSGGNPGGFFKRQNAMRRDLVAKFFQYVKTALDYRFRLC
jgi:hypothetical protein